MKIKKIIKTQKIAKIKIQYSLQIVLKMNKFKTKLNKLIVKYSILKITKMMSNMNKFLIKIIFFKYRL